MTHTDPNDETRDAWNANAEFWDERMAEGNDFFRTLIWPPTERLLGPVAGLRVLDVACENGVSSRRLAAMGARVVAFDFAEQMIEHAVERSREYGERIDYRVLDATDEAALGRLGEREFDAAVCNMALFDMARIGPLLRSLARLLKPGGPLVFSVLHPCFNHHGMSHTAEMVERDGEVTTQYAVKVWRYLTPTIERGLAMIGQPQLQLLFYRPLQELLGECFAAGFVLDGLVESAFPAGHESGTLALSWSGRYSEIPPVLVARARIIGG